METINLDNFNNALGDDDYSPFDKPIKQEIQERLDNEERREVEPPHPVVEETILKSVYCNYRGRLTVYDVHGQKVHDLSGMITYEKYTEIERRSNSDITEFDGIDDYRRIGAELKKTVVNDDQSGLDFSGFDYTSDSELDLGEPKDVPPLDPFAQEPIPASPQYHQPKININPPPGAGGFYSQL